MLRKLVKAQAGVDDYNDPNEGHDGNPMQFCSLGAKKGVPKEVEENDIQ